MKFVISFLLMALLSFTACLYFEWWSIAIVCFVVSACIPQRPGIAFLTGFTALFFLWGMMGLYISMNNEHILVHRISRLILQVDNPFLMITVTAVIGGVVGAFASLTGSLLRPKRLYA